MEFHKHLVLKSRIAQNAINATWKKVISNKHIPLSAKYGVFKSVVRSSLCYATQVWGYQKYEAVEKLQRNFVKKLFNLPINTPNYAIYLETGLSPLHIHTFKLQIDYILKVLSYEDDRLPKKMVMAEMKNKIWWAKEWKYLAERNGHNINMQNYSVESLKIVMYNLLQKVDEAERMDYVFQANNSDSRLVYSQLNYELNERNYFTDKHQCNKISFLFKLRCEVLNLNGTPYNNKEDQMCSLCNMNAKEDCFHFLAICPIYRRARQIYLGKITLNMSELLDILNGSNWDALYDYSRDAYKYRLMIMNEFF